MVDSLRDQLLKSGAARRFGSGPAARHRASAHKQGQRPNDNTAHPKPGMDLKRAYAERAKAEAAERRQATAKAQAEAAARKALKRRLDTELAGKALNKADADVARHFEYAGKIRRVYVDQGQLAALNRGELGLVQHRGRYVLVTSEVARQIGGFAADHVALLVESEASAAPADDGVPDDLIW